MNALIFGCGYLGQRVATRWLALGHTVFAVTRSSEKACALRESGVQPIVANFCDADLKRHLPEVDVVLNAVGFDRNPAQTQEQVMCGGLTNLLEAVTCKRLIQISSTSVYGQSGGEWVDEDSVCEPAQPGGKICLAAEQLVRDWSASREQTSFSILRLAGIYGPARLLSRIEALRAGTPISGSGDAWLNLIHVDDAADAVVRCAADEFADETFIVVDNRPIRRQEYFSQLASLVGAPVPTFDPDQVRARGAGGLNKRCSNRKIRSSLNWSPNYPTIETGLPAAINH